MRRAPQESVSVTTRPCEYEGGQTRYTVSDEVTQEGQKSAPSMSYTVSPSVIASPHEVQAAWWLPRGCEDFFALSLRSFSAMLYHLQ